MALTLNGSTGIAGIAGSAGTPALQGNNDANTGYFFATDTLGLSTAGTERLKVTAAGLISIGDNTNLDSQLTITQSVGDCIRLRTSASNNTYKYGIIKLEPYNNNALGVQIVGAKSDSGYTEVDIGGGIDGGYAATQLDFWTAANTTTATGSRRMRIASDGRIGINTTFTTYGTLNIKPLASGDHGAINVENSTQGAGQSNIIYRSVDLASTQWAEAVLKANSHKFTTGATERLNITSEGLQVTADNSQGSIRVNTSLNNYGVITVRDAGSTDIGCYQAENGVQGENKVNLVIRSVDLGSTNWAGARYNALYHQFNRMTTEVARIDDTGLVLAQGKGINFGAQAGSSNPDEEILDHYEEGTWTPTFTAASGSDSWTTKYGKYTRIGNRVTATFSCQNYSGNMTGNVGMSGLPFTVAARQYHGDYGTYKFNWPTNNYGSSFIFTNAGGALWDLYWDKDNAASVYGQGEYFVSGSYFEGNIHYRVS